MENKVENIIVESLTEGIVESITEGIAENVTDNIVGSIAKGVGKNVAEIVVQPVVSKTTPGASLSLGAKMGLVALCTSLTLVFASALCWGVSKIWRMAQKMEERKLTVGTSAARSEAGAQDQSPPPLEETGHAESVEQVVIAIIHEDGEEGETTDRSSSELVVTDEQNTDGLMLPSYSAATTEPCNSGMSRRKLTRQTVVKGQSLSPSDTVNSQESLPLEISSVSVHSQESLPLEVVKRPTHFEEAFPETRV